MFFFYTAFMGAILALFLHLCRKKLSDACALYIFSLFVVPDVARFFGVQFHSLLQLILIILFFLKFFLDKEIRLESFHFRYIIIRFWIPFVIFGFFGVIEYTFQFDALKRLLFSICLFYVFTTSIKDLSDVRTIEKMLTVAFLFAGVYGIMTYLLKTNPYYLSCATIFGIEDKEYLGALGNGYSNVRGGLSARATGTSLSSLIWGQKCLVFLPFWFHLQKVLNIKKCSMNTVAIVLCCVNIFLSGQRSCIFPMMLFLVYCFYRKYGMKNVIKCIPVLIIGSYGLLVVLNLFPSLQTFSSNLESSLFFWDDNLARKNNFGGSNLEMRMDQFFCALDMVRNHFLFGLGYSYPSYYSLHYGQHPIMLGFESLFFTSIVSSGFLGCCVWGVFFVENVKKSKSLLGFSMAVAFHGTYILSILMTGIQSTLLCYLIVSAIIVKESYIQQINTIRS